MYVSDRLLLYGAAAEFLLSVTIATPEGTSTEYNGVLVIVIIINHSMNSEG